MHLAQLGIGFHVMRDVDHQAEQPRLAVMRVVAALQRHPAYLASGHGQPQRHVERAPDPPGAGDRLAQLGHLFGAEPFRDIGHAILALAPFEAEQARALR